MVLGVITVLSLLIAVGTVVCNDWFFLWTLLWFAIDFTLLNLMYLIILYIVSLCLGTKEAKADSNICRFWVKETIRWFLALFRVKITCEGGEMFPAENVVVVCNHRSNFDPLVSLVAFPERRLAFITKPSNLKIPIAGNFVRRCSFLPVEREDPRSALRTVRYASQMMRTRGVDIAIYPEGTRSYHDEMRPFKEGGFYIAKKADAPLVIMSVVGTEDIAEHIFRKKTHVHIKVLEVLSQDRVKEMTLTELTAYAEERIRRDIEPHLVSENCVSIVS